MPIPIPIPTPSGGREPTNRSRGRHRYRNRSNRRTRRCTNYEFVMAGVDESKDRGAPGWRQRAVSKSLSAARSRAEQRAQGLLDAAFALIDERGTTQFTIQEVVDRSKQSLRGFYQYFESKDELLFALLEESIRESVKDLRSAVESESEPLERLRAFTIRLHEWCEPLGARRKRGAH